MKPLGWHKTGNKTHRQHGKSCPCCSPMTRKEIRRALAYLRLRDIWERWMGRGREKTQLRREAHRAGTEPV